MKTPSVFKRALILVATAWPLPVARAEEPLERTDLIQRDIALQGYEVVQVRVDFAPGVLAAKHSHHGEEVAYVLDGTLQYDLVGQKSVILHAGQSLFIPAGVVHSAKNVGTNRASELATYVVVKGKQLVVPTH